MKNAILLLLLFLCSFSVFGQIEASGEKNNKYKLRPDRNNQDTVYINIGKEKQLLKAGSFLVKTKGDLTVQQLLTKDTIIVHKKDSAFAVQFRWELGEVKFTDEDPDKLFLNPYIFLGKNSKHLNDKAYIKIPANSYVRLIRSFTKVTAVTIPFVIRPAIADTIGSKITTDLKVGTTYSYNINWETFRNRRIAAKRTAIGISFGVGGGLSNVTLNAASTSLSKEPYKREENGLAFFITPGIGLNIDGFQIALFTGWDLALTKNVKDWNYNKERFYGIGFGVDIKTLGNIF